MNSAFGKKLKELRKEKGLTQEALAHIFNVSKTTICQYETIKQEPDLTLLVKISRYFGVTTDYLLGIESDETNQIIDYEFEYYHKDTVLKHKEKIQ